MFGVREVNDPHSTGFSGACSTPAHFANAARPRHDNSGRRLLSDMGGDGATFVFGSVKGPLSLEERRLDYLEHGATIRLRRIAGYS